MLTTDQRQPKRKQPKRRKFTRHPDWLFDSRLSLTTRYVYLVLISYDWDAAGIVFPAVKTIAAKANIVISTAYKSLHELEAAGLITIKKRDGDSRHRNEYVIHALSQQQIDALCVCEKPDQEADDLPIIGGTTLRSAEFDLPIIGGEVDKEKKTKGSRRNGLDGRAAARASRSQVASQGSGGVAQDEATADSAGSGSLAGSAESKGERYERPLADPAKEAWAVRIADDAMAMLEIPEARREHARKTARYLIDSDEREPNEILAVIRRCVTDDRWRHVTDLFLVRRDYAKILADITSGKKPRPREETKATTETTREPRPPGARRIEI